VFSLDSNRNLVDGISNIRISYDLHYPTLQLKILIYHIFQRSILPMSPAQVASSPYWKRVKSVVAG
jgi:hypothetical protein